MLVIMIQCAGVARACGPTLKLVRCALLATEDGAAGLVRHPAMLMKCVCVCSDWLGLNAPATAGAKRAMLFRITARRRSLPLLGRPRGMTGTTLPRAGAGRTCAMRRAMVTRPEGVDCWRPHWLRHLC